MSVYVDSKQLPIYIAGRYRAILACILGSNMHSLNYFPHLKELLKEKSASFSCSMVYCAHSLVMNYVIWC